MSLFRPAARALTTEQYGWLNGDETTASMSAKRALSVVPVYAAVRLISETIASLPIHAYRRTPNGRQPVDVPRFVADPVDGSTTVEWVQRCMTSLLLQGAACGHVIGLDRIGQPDGIVWVDPARVARVVERGRARPTTFLDGRRMEDWEIVYIPAVVIPGSPYGVNPVRAFATTFDSAREVQEARRAVAKARQIPGSILKNVNKRLNDTESEVIAARAEAKIRNGKTFVHGSDWDFRVLELPSQDVAFLESIKADANQIASIYTVPPELIGGTSGGSLTYSTVEGQLNWILTMTTRTWITRLEAAWSRLTADTYLKFTPDAVVRTDTKTRFEVYKMARDIGMRNVDELRALEDLEPLPDGEGAAFTPASGSRMLSAAEVSQKVYLAVQAGVLTPMEGRELIRAAGADIDPAVIPPAPVVIQPTVTLKPGGAS